MLELPCNDWTQEGNARAAMVRTQEGNARAAMQ